MWLFCRSRWSHRDGPRSPCTKYRWSHRSGKWPSEQKSSPRISYILSTGLESLKAKLCEFWAGQASLPLTRQSVPLQEAGKPAAVADSLFVQVIASRLTQRDLYTRAGVHQYFLQHCWPAVGSRA